MPCTYNILICYTFSFVVKKTARFAFREASTDEVRIPGRRPDIVCERLNQKALDPSGQAPDDCIGSHRAHVLVLGVSIAPQVLPI